MTPLPTQGIPSTATAGDTWRWRLDGVADTASYPAADGWALSVKLRGPSALGPLAVDRTSGDVLTIAAASSAPLLPGLYTATLSASRGTGDAIERYAVGAASVTVLPNPESAGLEVSHAAKCVALLEAKIEGRVVSDAEVYAVIGQSLTRTPMETLVKMLAHYRAIVARERRGGRRPALRMSFGPGIGGGRIPRYNG